MSNEDSDSDDDTFGEDGPRPLDWLKADMDPSTVTGEKEKIMNNNNSDESVEEKDVDDNNEEEEEEEKKKGLKISRRRRKSVESKEFVYIILHIYTHKCQYMFNCFYYIHTSFYIYIIVLSLF